jgi:hypothetical protein
MKRPLTHAPRLYRGSVITHTASERSGWIPWGAYVGDRFVYADTLAGVKRLIRQALESGS